MKFKKNNQNKKYLLALPLAIASSLMVLSSSNIIMNNNVPILETPKTTPEETANENIMQESIGVKRISEKSVEIWFFIEDFNSTTEIIIKTNLSGQENVPIGTTQKTGWHTAVVYGTAVGTTYNSWKINYGNEYAIPAFDTNIKNGILWSTGSTTSETYLEKNGSIKDMQISLTNNTTKPATPTKVGSSINYWKQGEPTNKTPVDFKIESDDRIFVNNIENLKTGIYEIELTLEYEAGASPLATHKQSFEIQQAPKKDLKLVDHNYDVINRGLTNGEDIENFSLKNISFEFENLYYKNPNEPIMNIEIVNQSNVLDIYLLLNLKIIDNKITADDFVSSTIKPGSYDIVLRNIKYGLNNEIELKDKKLTNFIVGERSEEVKPTIKSLTSKKIDFTSSGVEVSGAEISLENTRHIVNNGKIELILIEPRKSDRIIKHTLDSNEWNRMSLSIKDTLIVKSLSGQMKVKYQRYTYNGVIDEAFYFNIQDKKSNITDGLGNQNKFIKSTTGGELVLNFVWEKNWSRTELIVIKNGNGNTISTVSHKDIHGTPIIDGTNNVLKTIKNVPLNIEQKGWTISTYDINYDGILDDYPIQEFTVTK